MILSEKKAIDRLSSPMNLMNRLNSLSNKNPRNSAMSLFIRPAAPTESKPIEQPKEAAQTIFNPFANKPSPPSPPVETQTEAISPQPQIENLVHNAEAQVGLALAHDTALKTLNKALANLDTKIDSVDATKLPSVITATSKVIESIRKERAEATKNNKEKEVHYHFYTPEQRRITDYDIIDVNPATPAG
jgi:hypothetical protein